MLSLVLNVSDGRPLVEQLVAGIRQHIEARLLRPGARLPSIRALADRLAVSRFTVIEAYDRLVASGYIESRRGSGFYVAVATTGETACDRTGALDRTVDVANLVAELHSDEARAAGRANRLLAGGCLPVDWQEESGIRRHARQVVTRAAQMTDFGTRLGFQPLREVIARRLAELGIVVTPPQILLTIGATHAFDLIIRYLVAPGDTVLVDDPGYFNLFGNLKLAGARLLPVPRGRDGPNLDVLASLAEQHRPKAYFTMSVLNNPTCTHMQPAISHRLLQLAAQHRFFVVEDDIFADFVENAPPRLAALDRLERTLYIGSFSKTLSSNVRVGFIAAEPESIDALSRIKLLTTITTSEFAENLVYEMLLAGHYRKHVAHLRDRLAMRRARMASELERAGWEVYGPPDAGMFLWARHPAVADSVWTAQGARAQGLLLAAGASFRPLHEPSPWMRFNAACSTDAGVYQLLARAPELARRAEAAARIRSEPARAAA